MKYKQCNKCGREISNSNFNKHIVCCRGVIKKRVRGIDYDPNIGFKNGTRTIWNKGLNKNIDTRVKKFGETISKIYKGVKRKPLSEEHKAKLSKAKIELYNKFPEKHPNRKLAGNLKKMTYPEKLVYKYLENLKLKPEHNKRTLNYFPDFIIKKNIIIEVDGEYWHKDKSTELERDNKLKEAGYTIYRIPAKNVITHLKEVLRGVG